jgi:hypothetical protein
MSKRRKLSFLPLEDLPDEILLKIFSLLDIKGVFQCGQVSKRLRAISNDQSLWSKLNLFEKEVPYGFIEKAVQNGCEYLNLRCSSVHGSKKSKVPWKLKYLDISQSDRHRTHLYVPEEVLQNCHFLEKLAVDSLKLKSHNIEQICQNGKTLQILSLGQCIQPASSIVYKSELMQKLFTKCHQLTEVNMFRCLSHMGLLDPHVCALVDNLTPNILKLDLGYQKSVNDKHVNTLVRRCNKITELQLSDTSITNDSVKSIVKHLNSLENLGVYCTNIDFSTLLQLKSIPTLKVLHCFDHGERDTEKIKNLKLQLPHISINPPDDHLHIATSRKKEDWHLYDWFWEIKANQQDLFPKAHC